MLHSLYVLDISLHYARVALTFVPTATVQRYHLLSRPTNLALASCNPSYLISLHRLAKIQPTEPPLALAIFRLQNVCVHVQHDLRKHLRTAALEKAPQIEATFRWLRKRGIAVYLLSDYNRPDTQLLLDRLGWRVGDHVFIQCVISHSPLSKDPIGRALQLFERPDPARTLFVGDTLESLQLAHQHGLRYNLGVTSGCCSYQSLQFANCRTLLDSPLQLVQYLLEELPELLSPLQP